MCWYGKGFGFDVEKVFFFFFVTFFGSFSVKKGLFLFVGFELCTGWVFGRFLQTYLIHSCVDL